VDDSIPKVLSGEMIPFEANGTKYWIRQPLTEDLDEAEFIQRLIEKRTLLRPEVAELCAYPCTPEARTGFEFEIQKLETLYRDLDPKEVQRLSNLARRIADFRRRVESYNLGQELADERSILARDRFLCIILLCNEAGSQVIGDTSTKEGLQQWEDLDRSVKERARPAIWKVMRLVDELPFG